MKIQVLFLLFILLSMSFTFADNKTIEEETEELKVFENHQGARMRMLQLERALMKNILVGEAVIEIITTNHPDDNLIEIQGYLADLKALLEEVRGLDFNGTAEELSVEFSSVKTLSVELTKNFKELVSAILTPEDKEQIRDAIKELDFSEINEEIKAAQRE